MDQEKINKNKNPDKLEESEATVQPKTPDGEEAKALPKKVKRQATQEQLDHPLHGVKLVQILESLVEHYGWEYLSKEVRILCFKHNPTMKVSLKFLRKYKWAREHVEDIYMDMLEDDIYKKRQAIKKAENKS